MKIEVYSDGSATIASKPGGYGWVIVVEGEKKAEGSGHMSAATNNDAELEAAIQGLAAVLKMRLEHRFPIEAHEITLVTDSEIIINWATGRYRFKQAHKRHKYDQLMFLVNKLDVKTRWVEGHTGDEHNERCDYLANVARKGASEPVKKTRKNKTKELQSEIETLKNEILKLKEELSQYQPDRIGDDRR